jgi:SAM-dependent methyltransferase
MGLARNPAIVAFYRMIAPVLDPRYVWRGLRDYPRYFAELTRYRRMLRDADQVAAVEMFPSLHERTSSTSFDPHYCYMGFWATEKLRGGTAGHVDVASQISWVMALAAMRPVKFVDIRPFETHLPNLTVETGTVLSLPFADRSVASLSCLHVVEHVGLGRYGDPLDPLGSEKAIAELARVLAPGGKLLFALPVGRERVSFNAHRVHAPRTIISHFRRGGLELASFAAVDDERKFHSRIDPEQLSGADYACGMFEFIRTG